ncbi:10803_t:CDS:2, partial [Racocetra fulgida]
MSGLDTTEDISISKNNQEFLPSELKREFNEFSNEREKIAYLKVVKSEREKSVKIIFY